MSAEDFGILEFINPKISYFTPLHKQYIYYFYEIPQLSDVQENVNLPANDLQN